jgi:hypothetical protein
MLDLFEKNGQRMKSNFRFQFWQHENHPILLNTKEMYSQRLIYFHENPERAGFEKRLVAPLIIILKKGKAYWN